MYPLYYKKIMYPVSLLICAVAYYSSTQNVYQLIDAIKSMFLTALNVISRNSDGFVDIKNQTLNDRYEPLIE